MLDSVLRLNIKACKNEWQGVGWVSPAITRTLSFGDGWAGRNPTFGGGGMPNVGLRRTDKSAIILTLVVLCA